MGVGRQYELKGVTVQAIQGLKIKGIGLGGVV